MPTFADTRWLPAIAACVVLAAFDAHAAQTVESQETVKRIVGSNVRQEEARTETQTKKIISAIERTRENIGTVRKTSKLESVDIVFLTDAARSEGGPPPAVENKVKEHQDDITELREEIEANALLFNAIDSRRVLAEDVLAVEFDDPGKLVIYAAAKPPG
jgi:ABC-type Fe3+-citrate transport system substrate-binding protein